MGVGLSQPFLLTDQPGQYHLEYQVVPGLVVQLGVEECLGVGAVVAVAVAVVAAVAVAAFQGFPVAFAKVHCSAVGWWTGLPVRPLASVRHV